ncbi:F-box/FBD/LRR-repeat protein At1g13570-like isoform X1 [Telopea speciosissima]|uniref:F-box/FBD/LRR-repeat protein At1g13570-like isoform X1 n=1 Tax=Telopea speciosissima TaxID=54955 RepID=UPI001CC620BF|nr:F-box/FBD/LRR-repeat protein At1g13570-like isoform X1 [Telopea speciosissima]
MEMASCSTLDILSNLPENLVEKIFLHLSTRDVVRTSVLSTKWRHKWISVPHLIFNDECIPVSVGSLGHDKLVKIVNHILLLHRGPVLKFHISNSQLKSCSDIDSWILHLTLLNSVEEFELQISKSVCHVVPPCLFSFGHLIQLKLIGCKIIPPVTFKGFSYLKSLFFKKVTLSNASLECLLSTCPWLEMLSLIDIDGPTHVEIRNPNLKYLLFDDKSIGISLKDLRLLVYANLCAINVAHSDQQGTCNFINNLGSLLNIQKLVMKGWFLESLAVGDVPRRLPFTFDHLKSISFPLNVEDMKVILVAICLLNSSPNLQELEILLHRNREYAIVPVMDLQEAKDQLECTFNKLRVVNMSKLFGTEIELVLIKSILANSPVLETMSISTTTNGVKKLTLLKELLQFKRTSQRAKIVHLD